MTLSSRFNGSLLAALCSSIGAFALACSDGDSNPDGGDASVAPDAVDDWDGGHDAGSRDVHDARSRDAADVGIPDLGSCGCSYGFQQQCAEDESCGLGFEGAPKCERAEPFGGTAFGGCSMAATATAAGGEACTAQCVSALEGSPCGSVARGLVESNLGDWQQAIVNASFDAPGAGPHAMDGDDIAFAILRAPTPKCGEFIKWTVIAAWSLCLGEGAAIPPTDGRFSVTSEWRFRHIESDDTCQAAAVSHCVGAISAGASFGEGAAIAVDDIPPSCPVLPYGTPCDGADAQMCLRNRIATMIRALRTPPRD